MRAIIISRPGGPEVLELREVPAPQPMRGEVRVRVRATAVNRADLLQRMGFYPAPPEASPDIPGLEYAGEIDALGPGVTNLAVGDRVFGLAGGGTYAEQLVLHSREVVKIPSHFSFIEAAAVPEAFITAHDALVTQGGLTSGERVLIHAVGSGVGTAAVQVARAIGARAIGTARTADKLDRAYGLGLSHGILVAEGHFAKEVLSATDGEGVDLVLELIGGSYVAEDLACMRPRGRLLLVGLLAGARTELDLALVLRRRLTLLGTVLRSRPLEEKIAAARTFAHQLVPLFQEGRLTPVIDRTFPLEKAAEAHTHVASNTSFGKTVLTLH